MIAFGRRLAARVRTWFSAAAVPSVGTYTRIVEVSRVHGIDTTVPEVPWALAKSAVARGYGRDGFSRTIDVLRSPGAGT